MADRYLNIPIIKSETGKRYFKTTIYPKIEASESDYYIETNTGDRLDLLARDFYGDVTDWWIISVANSISCDSLYIEPGTQLRIPTNVNEIKKKFRDLNNNR